MTTRTELTRIPVDAPDDMSGLEAFLRECDGDIIGIIAQNEGDTFARGFTLHRLEETLAAHLGCSTEEIAETVPLLMIGLAGMALMVPHLIVLWRAEVADGPVSGVGLTIGRHVTPEIAPHEVGTLRQVELVRDAVEHALADSGISDPEDVHCVYVKVPELTPGKKASSKANGIDLDSADYRDFAARSRGTGALGVGLAFGEISSEAVTEDAICADSSLYSKFAQISSGTENDRCKVLVIGNRSGVASTLQVSRGVMKDALDVDGLKGALRSGGLDFNCCPTQEQIGRIESVFIKTAANTTEEVRGRRHTMQTDSLWSSSGAQAKAAIHAIVSGIVQDTMVLGCSGSEHQGLPGTSTVAVFVRSV